MDDNYKGPTPLGYKGETIKCVNASLQCPKAAVSDITIAAVTALAATEVSTAPICLPPSWGVAQEYIDYRWKPGRNAHSHQCPSENGENSRRPSIAGTSHAVSGEMERYGIPWAYLKQSRCIMVHLIPGLPCLRFPSRANLVSGKSCYTAV